MNTSLDHYLSVLRGGGVIACPTETLQGLLADAHDGAAVERVVRLKRRGSDAIGLLVPDLVSALTLCETPSEQVLALLRAHWPGPLTVVMRARERLHPAIAPEGTVGVRVPGPSPALDLVRAFGGPLTATSCNLSGQPAARTHAEARAYFEGQVDAFVNEDAPGGPPSTVLDATGPALRILRHGALAL